MSSIVTKHGNHTSRAAVWNDFFTALKDAEVPPDFLDRTERAQEPHDRDPFQGWRE